MHYGIMGNIYGIQISRIVNLYHFTGLIFADECIHSHIVYYTIELILYI